MSRGYCSRRAGPCAPSSTDSTTDPIGSVRSAPKSSTATCATSGQSRPRWAVSAGPTSPTPCRRACSTPPRRSPPRHARAGVEQVVNLSQWLQEGGEQPTPHQPRHWLVEQIFDWSGVGAVHLDATVFYENLRTWALLSLARAGVIALPWGPEATAIPMVGAEDVARVAAAVLTGPALSSGTVVRLMAGAVTNKEIAEAFSEILGGSVGYVEVNDDQWASDASAVGVNAVAVEHLTHLWRYLRTRPPEYQAFYHITDAFEHFTSRPPQSLPQFLREHKDLFAEATPR